MIPSVAWSKPCQHRHLHPGRYEGRFTVCLDCRREVQIQVLPSSPAEIVASYTRGRALAAEDLKNAPLWPASRQDYAGLTRSHDDPDFDPTPEGDPTE